MVDFTAQRIQQFAADVNAATAAAIAQSLTAHAADYGLTTPLRAAHFMGQMSHESGGFTHFQENLNYSADRIGQVWPRLKPRAQQLAHNPQALGNAAYAGKLGNGDEASGDGYRFRGRGLVQITGRANYHDMGGKISVDLTAAPDSAADPVTATLVALAFWNSRGCNAAADTDSCEAVTRIINGPALAGLADRQAQTNKAKTIFV